MWTLPFGIFGASNSWQVENSSWVILQITS